MVQLLRKWENLAVRKTRNRCSLVFSLRCKEEHITPKYLRLKTALKHTKRTQQILDKTSRKLLQENIGMLTNQIKALGSQEEAAKEIFECSVRANPTAEQAFIDEVLEKSRKFVFNRKEKEHAHASERQVNKLDRLKKEKNDKYNKNRTNTNAEQQQKWVRNLSHYNLSETEQRVLAKGLKFAITPDQTPVDDYIVATETVCRDLPTSEANELRCEVVRILSDGTKPKSNITKEERKALKNLSKENSIVMLPADKGSCTVVMDHDEYTNKVNTMLSDEKTYKKLKKDPSETTKKQLIKKLTSLKDQ